MCGEVCIGGGGRWGDEGGMCVCGRGRHCACRRQRRGVHLRARSPVETAGGRATLRRAALGVGRGVPGAPAGASGGGEMGVGGGGEGGGGVVGGGYRLALRRLRGGSGGECGLYGAHRTGLLGVGRGEGRGRGSRRGHRAWWHDSPPRRRRGGCAAASRAPAGWLAGARGHALHTRRRRARSACP
jgi:hypothetical protein